MILVTGGAGFIGANFILDWIGTEGSPVINVDELTYAGKIRGELQWRPQESFESGLKKTVHWYLNNADWVRDVTSGAYRTWLEKNYTARGAA